MPHAPEIDKLIALYDEAERVAKQFVPNRAIQAFSTATFGQVGYPDRISHGGELWRFHDVMHERQFGRNMRLLGQGLDQQSGAQLAREAAENILRFAEKFFGIKSAGKEMLSRALYQFACLETALRGKTRPWSVVEIGPGCGYLGLLIGLSGNRYTAVEASQAFFIYQSLLYKEVFGDLYFDGLSSDKRADAVIAHVPWWQFCAEGASLEQYSCATANHMISEMTKSGLEFVFAKFKATQNDGFFCLADNLGADTLRPHQKVIESISARGFDVRQQPNQLWTFSKTSHEPKILLLRDTKSRARRLSAFVGRKYRRLGSKVGLLVADETPVQNASVIEGILAEYPDWESGDSRFSRWVW